MQSKTDALVREAREHLQRAKAITSAAREANRGLTQAEEAEVKAAMAKSEAAKAEHDAVLTRRSLGGGSASFKAIAAQLANGGRAEARLKGVTEVSTDLLTTRIEPGVTALPYDQRYLFPVFETIDPGNVLHVTDFRVQSHGTTGTVERDPQATTTKAEALVTIDGFTADMKQLAILVSDIPNALLASEAQLSSVLESEMRLEIRKALDAHVVSQISAASVSHGGFGATVQARVRSGINEMAETGFRPDVVAINPDDAEAIDLLKVTDEIGAWPFGLRVVVTPDVSPMAPMLIDTGNAGVLYQGNLAVQADPYTGFKTNVTTLRAEGLALFVVRRPGAILVADGTGS